MKITQYKCQNFPGRHASWPPRKCSTPAVHSGVAPLGYILLPQSFIHSGAPGNNQQSTNSSKCISGHVQFVAFLSCLRPPGPWLEKTQNFILQKSCIQKFKECQFWWRNNLKIAQKASQGIIWGLWEALQGSPRPMIAPAFALWALLNKDPPLQFNIGKSSRDSK